MPRIQEYQQRVDIVAGPQESRRTFADTSVGEGFSQIGQTLLEAGEVIQRRAEQSEISELNARMAETHSQFTNQWRENLQKGYEGASDEEIVGDPAERPMVKNFVKSYDDHIEKIREKVTTSAGQRYLQSASAQMKAHFFENAVAGQAQLAGQRAVQNYTKTVNSYSASLMNDPSAHQMVKQLHDEAIDNLVATQGLPAEAAMKLKTQGHIDLAKSSIRGWIDLNPQEALAELKSGKWDNEIDGDLKRQLFGEADQAIRGQRAEEERMRAEQERALKESQKSTQNDFLAKMVSGKLSAKDILKSNLEAFGSGSKEQFIGMLKTRNDEARQPKTDWSTFRDTYARIHLPDGDPKKLLDENELNGLFVQRKLSFEDLNRLRGEMQGKRTQAGSVESELKKKMMDVAAARLTKSNPMMGIKDPDGEEQMLKFSAFFFQEFEDQRKQGKSALQLLSPDSPDYLGKYIGQYARTPEQIIQGMTRNMRMTQDGRLSETPGSLVEQPGTTSGAKAKPPRNPGESAKDYLKRIGG